MPYHFLTGLILLITCFINYTESEWKLELDKEGILVYTRHVVGSDFKEFKAEIDIDGTLSDVADVIADVERYPEWCYKTASVKVIEKKENRVQYFYVSDTPSFLKTRVAFFQCDKSINKETNEITFSLTNIQADKPIPGNSLLIPIMKGSWILTPAGGHKVHITMQMLTEPGGVIPSWLSNMVVVDSPFVTLKNLRERVKTITKH